MIIPRAVFGEPLAAPESEIKAAFVYNFAKLTEWPSDAFASVSDPFVIGVLGEDLLLLDALKDATRGRHIHGREVRVVAVDNISGQSPCHLLYISKLKNLEKVLSGLKQRPILTISDLDGFTQSGGMIGLTKNDRRMRFEVRKEVANRAGLRMSSKLLALAKVVPD